VSRLTTIKDNRYYQVNAIKQEQARVSTQKTYRRIFGDLDDLDAADLEAEKVELMTRRAAVKQVLELYTGSLCSLQTPMSRFMTMSPTHDTHLWMANDVLEQAGIGFGDLEALEIRKFAAEIMSLETPAGESQDANVGSPRPDSDTLSVSRCRGTNHKDRRQRGRGA
jgi:hypothetical protein